MSPNPKVDRDVLQGGLDSGSSGSRRAFLRTAIGVASGTALGGCSEIQDHTAPSTPDTESTPEPCGDIDTPLGYGLLLLSESEIERCERDLLGGWRLDVVTTTWGDQRSPYWDGTAPLWVGRSGTGTDLERKKNDLESTFGGTERRWCPMYRISEGKRNYQPALDGELDDDWRAFAGDLVEMDMQDTIIRPNPEFSNEWGRYPHEYDSQGNELGPVKPPNEAGRVYAAAFARCMRVMQSVDGADFTFAYNPAGHRFGITREAWPPGSPEWRDWMEKPIVTPTFYDSWHMGGPKPAKWKTMTDDEKEAAAIELWESEQLPWLRTYERFAESVGTDIGTVEWGVSNADTPTGRGDNPWFVDLLMSHMRDNGWAFASWWNTEGARGGSSRIWPPDRSNLPRSRHAWALNVLTDVAKSLSDCRSNGG